MLDFVFCGPYKGTSLRGTASFDVFCVDVRGGVLAVGDRTEKNSRVTMAREVEHARKLNSLSDLDKISPIGRYPRLNHLCKFW